MAPPDSRHRPEAFPGPLLRHWKHHDVHARIHFAGYHAAAAAVLANHAGIYRARGRPRADAGRIRDPAVHASRRVSAVEIRSALADGLWAFDAVVRSVPYD